MNDTHLPIFIGTYTSPEGSRGIYQVNLDTANGTFGEVALIAETVNPSYLVLNRERSILYTVNENVPDGMITAFERNSGDQWTPASALSNVGSAPCHLTLNENQSLIAVANYVSGNVVAYPLDATGSLLDEASAGQHAGAGPNTERQEAPHAHFVQFSKDGRWLYAVDLGIDEIKMYPLDNGRLGDARTALRLSPGDGPRHFVFHPVMDMAYVLNELSNTVIAVRVDQASGQFTAFDRQSTLPEDFSEHSQAAAIKISKDGRFLYVSNRGHQSIAIYALAEDGKPTLVAITTTEGAWPRDFMLTPNEEHLLVANEHSDNIALFDRDVATGLITYSGQQLSLSKPVCLIY